jgi:hypothetical protein
MAAKDEPFIIDVDVDVDVDITSPICFILSTIAPSK